MPGYPGFPSLPLTEKDRQELNHLTNLWSTLRATEWQIKRCRELELRDRLARANAGHL